MARFKARVFGLVTVLAIAIGIATLVFWQDPLPTVQAAQADSTYVVERGDSLYTIAAKFDVNVTALAEANHLSTTAPLSRRQVLIIPSAESSGMAAQDVWAESTPEATEEMMDEEATPEATEEVVDDAAPEAMMAAESAAPQTYTIKAGDSLGAIAKQFGVSREALAAANGLNPNNPLYRGMVLTIPSTEATASETPAAAAPPPAASDEEATPEATEEMMDEEATPEAAEEAMDEEATPEATEEMMDEEATPEATEEMMDEEATPEATEEMMDEEATPEATEEMMDEEATPEATEEMMDEEATPEATEEMMDEEATPEATEEMMDEEATPEATEEMMDEEATPEATEEMMDEEAEATILDTITEMGDFTVLLEALEAAGLSETLATDGPFTLFAPTDAAFDALPAGTIDGLLASPPDDLSQILLYHLIPGEVLASDFVDGVTVITAQGGTVTIGVTPDGLTVNDVNITISDIETSNGVIHVIDAVLLPSASIAAVPRGMAAPENLEAASGDAASVIVVPINIADTEAAARFWPQPEGAIALYSPVATGGYHSPINVVGLSDTYGGHVAINLTAPDGTVLAQRMTLGGEDAYAFFQTSLRFYVNERTEATLSVHEIDMADGTILSTVDTVITLLPGQRFLDVTGPAVGQSVCPPILVSGYSNTFEANVVLSLRTPDGTDVTQLPTIGGSMGFYRDFATPLPYTVDEATPLLISITETDTEGILSTIDETVIPITLFPAYSAVCY